MKRSIATLASIAALAACGQSSEGQAEAADGNDAEEQAAAAPEPDAVADGAEDTAITCGNPVRPDDTVESLRARYGDDARPRMVFGAEGAEIPGVVLWADDPSRKVEVLFEDLSRSRVTSVRIYDDAEWSIGGLKLGDTLTRATEVNGTPFELFGFEWDYGGTVLDFKGGSLENIGDCRLVMDVGPTPETELPLETLGEVVLTSDDPRLQGDGVVIWQLGLGYPE